MPIRIEPIIYKHVHGTGVERTCDEYIVYGNIIVHMLRSRHTSNAFIGKRVDELPDGAVRDRQVSELLEGDREVVMDVIHDMRGMEG